MTEFQTGQRVQWCFRGSWRGGVVVAIVPPGDRPLIKNKQLKARDHQSYLVAARRLNSASKPTGPEEIFWPKVKLLRVITH